MGDVHCVLCDNLGEITLFKKQGIPAMLYQDTERMYQYLKEETPEVKLLCICFTYGITKLFLWENKNENVQINGHWRLERPNEGRYTKGSGDAEIDIATLVETSMADHNKLIIKV
jgi:hypothetical protein